MAEEALASPRQADVALRQGRNPDVDYERRDVSPRLLGLLALGLFVVVVGAAAGLAQLFPPGTSPLFLQQPPATPPDLPRLEIDPPADLAALRLHAEFQLDSYGWVDRQKGIAHVPIDEAISRVAERGIPDWRGREP
jgi:hypothetical protein